MSASCRKPQRQWKFRKVGLAVPGFYGPKKLWLQLDCLGAWTCHGQLTTKGPISRGYDLELPDQPTLWQVTHVSTGLGLCVTLGQDHARQLVEFGVWGAMEQKTDISAPSEFRRRHRQASRT